MWKKTLRRQNSDESREITHTLSAIRFKAQHGYSAGHIAPLDSYYQNDTHSAYDLKKRLVDPLLLWGRMRNLALFSIELAAIADPRRLYPERVDDTYSADEYSITFRPNYWVNSRLMELESEKQSRVAYRKAIDSIKDIGSALQDREYFDFAYIHAEIDTSACYSDSHRRGLANEAVFDIIDAPLTRDNPVVASAPKYLKDGKLVSRGGKGDTSDGLEDFLCRHHHSFCESFVKSLVDLEIKVPFRTLHYIAVPFQRLQGIVDGEIPGRDENVPLEGAGCLYVSFGILADSPEQSMRFVEQSFYDTDYIDQESFNQLDLLTSELRMFTSFLCSHQAYWYAEQARDQVKAKSDAISAYDSMGHMLRAFVRSTGYENASIQLDSVFDVLGQHAEYFSDNLLQQLIATIENAQSSLDLFRHVEGLSSLFRMHGWLTKDEFSERTITQKVREQFDETALRTMDFGEYDRHELEEGFATAVKEFFAPLVFKETEISLRIITAGTRMEETLEYKTIDSSVSRRAFQVIPFSDKLVDSNSFLLAMTAALVEPFRNATVHYRNFGKRTDHKVIDFVISAKSRRRYDVWIINDWLKEEPCPDDVSMVSGGLRLTNVILEDMKLGKISNDIFDEFEIDSQSERVCLKISFTPINAFKTFVPD